MYLQQSTLALVIFFFFLFLFNMIKCQGDSTVLVSSYLSFAMYLEKTLFFLNRTNFCRVSQLKEYKSVFLAGYQ